MEYFLSMHMFEKVSGSMKFKSDYRDKIKSSSFLSETLLCYANKCKHIH